MFFINLYIYPYKLIRRTVESYLEHNGPHLAAAISYYTLFSLFPLLLAVASIVGFVARSSSAQTTIINNIADFIPVSRDFVQSSVESVVEQRGAAVTIATVSLLWAGMTVFSAMRKSINLCFGITKPRPFLREKGIEALMMIGGGVLILLSLAVTTALRVARSLSVLVTPHGFNGELVWQAAGGLVPLLLTFGTFAMLYRYIPNRVIRWRDVWLGALLSAIGFEAFKNIFVWYVNDVANYSAIYGSLGALVAFLMWVYVSVTILLWGSEFCLQYPQVMDVKKEIVARWRHQRAELARQGMRPELAWEMRPWTWQAVAPGGLEQTPAWGDLTEPYPEEAVTGRGGRWEDESG